MTDEKKYDLEERTYKFARDVYKICKKIKSKYFGFEYINQVIRSSASIGSNYIEANESLSKKDFIYRTKICRKEAKETEYWLRLLLETAEKKNSELETLYKESIELKKIFSAIINKTTLK
ncbi:MAG: four helix bundle protein [Ignavibacteriae bacterium]|nr:four helix bundle protein [Ignavibacteriota bacterium]NOG97321.1 four helix bundle protein [Ignavibacteriota bacterium]